MLPPIKRIVPRHELDYYGFSRILAKNCDLDYLPHPLISSWKHGWLPKFALKFKEQIAQEGNENSHIVANTQYQKEFLQNLGYSNVYSAGLPFCYSDKADLSKMTRSLLIVPCHTLQHIGFSSNLDDFFENSFEISKKFEHVAVLEHQDSDFSKYKKKFPALKTIKGASAHDINSLHRIRLIFGAFENMLTNGFGSHLIYGSLEGMKISIIDPFYSQSVESLKSHPWYLKNSHLFAISDLFSEKSIRKELPFFFKNILDQEVYYEWAYGESGQDQVLNKNDISDVLAWHGNKMFLRSSQYPKAFVKNLIKYKTEL